MTLTTLSNNERAGSEFSHKVTLDYTDFTTSAGAAATTVLIPILTVPIGHAVMGCATRVNTAFTHSDTSTTCAIVAGYGGATANFLASQVVGGDGGASASGYAKYKVTANVTDTIPYAFVAADAVDVIFTCASGTTSLVDDTTAGNLDIFLKVVDLADMG